MKNEVIGIYSHVF